MIKLAFAFLVLFYLCYCAQVTPDPNLNKEMITKMTKLNENVRFPSGFILFYPGKQMHKNASKCVIPFIRGLEKVLQNVSVPEDVQHHLTELKINLEKLESAQGNTHNNATCIMVKKSDTSLPFNQYILFMQKLNSSKK